MNNTKAYLILVFYLFIPGIAYSADESLYTCSGYISNFKSGEAIVGAYVTIEGTKKGSVSNKYGFFSLSLPKGKYSLKINHVGYHTKEIDILIENNIKMNIQLDERSFTSDELVISADQNDKNIQTLEIGVVNLTPNTTSKLPVIFGEQDILKSLQMLPGISNTSEGNSGFFVRGGTPDQNLILLDEATVYNPSHLMGFFSVFNPDVLNNVKMIKGTAPAQYGGRLSSILDISMKEGNNKEYKFKGGIGLISSKLSFEGPIVEDKGSFIVSGRRTYADLLIALANNENTPNASLYFYDLNLKANYQITQKDKMFLSFYFGRDAANLKDQLGFDWGNFTSTLRWNHIFSSKLFSNLSLIFSSYDYIVNFDNGENLIDLSSSIKDINIKNDFQYFLNNDNIISFGLNAIYHTFTPGELRSTDANSSTLINVGDKYALEHALYLSHNINLTRSIKMEYGLRYSGFSLVGPGEIYYFDEEGDVNRTEVFDDFQLIKYYGGLEPRLLLNYVVNDENSLKLSYTRNYQYLHLLSNTTSTTPLDIWQPSTNNVKPGIADQITAGYHHNFNDNMYVGSLEVYYKDLQNQIDYRNGADLLLNDNVEAELLTGKGWAYGIELLIEKKFGNLTGWIGYTWSTSERQFEGIDNNEPFPSKYDRTHDISLVAMYTPSSKISVTCAWVFHTGNAVTFPSGKYEINGKTINLFTERNGYRMADYHRLDLSFTYRFDTTESGYGSNIQFSIYNVYGKRNPYIISFQEDEDNPDQTQIVSTYLFSIIPSISYNFNF